MMERSEVAVLLDRLFDHFEWADRRALQALRTVDPPPEDAVRIFAHILGSEETWLSRLEGRAPTLAVWPEMDLAECERRASEVSGHLHRWVRDVSGPRLNDVIRYRTSTGNEFETRVVDILSHVCLHGAYHRGQIALLVRRAGGEPVATDLVVFAREG